MPFYAVDHERILSGRMFGGEAFFETKDRAKEVAKEARAKFNVLCRSVTIPGNQTYAERYLVMLVVDEHNEDIEAASVWIRGLEDAEI